MLGLLGLSPAALFLVVLAIGAAVRIAWWRLEDYL